jgi:hypothetical protein
MGYHYRNIRALDCWMCLEDGMTEQTSSVSAEAIEARAIVTEWIGMFDPPPQIDFQQSEFLQQAIATALRSFGHAPTPAVLIPTPEQIEPILDDYLGVDCPHYEEMRRRCAQRIFDLCVVMSGAPIQSSNRIATSDTSTDRKEQP